MLRIVRTRIGRLSLTLAASMATTVALADDPVRELLRLPDEPPSAVSLPGMTANEADTVRERYPNGTIKIERTVALDANDNYVNHGPWTMWDELGHHLGGGEYRSGKREGRWVRHFQQGDIDVLATPLSDKFQAPYTAEATFAGDKLHGVWTMIDSRKRVVFSWSYENGNRHGKCVWFFPNGQPWREATYIDGQLDGDLIEVGPDQSLVRKDTYRQGRQLGIRIEYHAPNVKKLEASMLMARESEGTADDFWHGVSLPLAPNGRVDLDQRHGLWTTWHRNGQVEMQGMYENDQPEGPFVWFHPNGQKAIEGNFSHGQPSGSWSWWHDNGLKEMRGTYLMGLQAGKWNHWDADGKLVEAFSFPETGAPIGSVAGMALKPTFPHVRPNINLMLSGADKKVALRATPPVAKVATTTPPVAAPETSVTEHKPSSRTAAVIRGTVPSVVRTAMPVAVREQPAKAEVESPAASSASEKEPIAVPVATPTSAAVSPPAAKDAVPGKLPPVHAARSMKRR